MKKCQLTWTVKALVTAANDSLAANITVCTMNRSGVFGGTSGFPGAVGEESGETKRPRDGSELVLFVEVSTMDGGSVVVLSHTFLAEIEVGAVETLEAGPGDDDVARIAPDVVVDARAVCCGGVGGGDGAGGAELAGDQLGLRVVVRDEVARVSTG